MAIPHAWTFSHLDQLTTCPKRYYHLRVAKDTQDDPPGEAIMWGRKAHTAFENRIKYSTPFPEGMTQWEPMAQKILALPGEKFAEHKMALDINFKPTAYKTAWTRGITDLFVVNGKKAATADYKTGKFKPSDQLRLYSAYILASYPEIETVDSAFIWLKDKKVSRETVTRETVPAVWQDIMPVVRKLEHAYDKNVWPAKPSGLCREWCPVLKCEHNGRRAK